MNLVASIGYMFNVEDLYDFIQYDLEGCSALHILLEI